jgi:uncharacterized protein (DUF427 family)/diadenosine tetraphosphate (Ap4A) HIT family hydrolase
MATRRPAAEAGITIEPNPSRVVVRVDGLVIADSTRALVMRAPGSPDTQYIPREDADMARLVRTAHATHCPYKGAAAYYSIQTGDRLVDNAVWTYESPYSDVSPIAGHLAFYPERVDAIEERPAEAGNGSACVFCTLAAGTSAAARVAESPATLTVMALHPFRPGHVLVIPRAHAASLWVLDAAAYDEVMREARRAAVALQAAYAPPKVGLMVSGFEVEHAHVHVVPLYERHDLTSKRALDRLVAATDPAALAAEAARIRTALEAGAAASRR